MMDAAHSISHTPTVAELIAVAPDTRAWLGNPARGQISLITEFGASDEHRHSAQSSRRSILFDPLAPTEMLGGRRAGLVTEATPLPLGFGEAQFHGAVDQSSNGVGALVKQRTKLLAMKYANAESTDELIARLEILNARVGRLIPRVDPLLQFASDADSAQMKAMSAELDDLISAI